MRYLYYCIYARYYSCLTLFFLNILDAIYNMKRQGTTITQAILPAVIALKDEMNENRE